jgi:hypothetical protein
VVSFIRVVFHPEWLANPVLVRKKKTNEWRMCVDYTDLNKHCPKDPCRLCDNSPRKIPYYRLRPIHFGH